MLSPELKCYEMEDLMDLEWHELNSVRGQGEDVANSEV